MTSLLSRALVRLCACAFFGLGVSAPAAAEEFRYVYLGNTIPMSFSHYLVPPDSPYYDYTTTGRIVVEVIDDAPLTAGTSLSDVKWFRMSVQAAKDPGHHFSIQTPLIPGDTVCCWVWHELSGDLKINSVDAHGLPTDWNIWLQDYWILPTGRHDVTGITSTTGRDGFTAGNEDGFAAGGSGPGGGTWLAMPIPEPSTYALMMAGVGLLAVIARRRSSAGQVPGGREPPCATGHRVATDC